jgi:hypothetical protein
MRVGKGIYGSGIEYMAEKSNILLKRGIYMAWHMSMKINS